MNSGPAVWVALGRLLGQAGKFRDAERSFLSAADLDDFDAPREVVRAAGWARIRGDEQRYEELIAKAEALAGGSENSAVMIARARDLRGYSRGVAEEA